MISQKQQGSHPTSHGMSAKAVFGTRDQHALHGEVSLTNHSGVEIALSEVYLKGELVYTKGDMDKAFATANLAPIGAKLDAGGSIKLPFRGLVSSFDIESLDVGVNVTFAEPNIDELTLVPTEVEGLESLMVVV